MTRSSPGRLVIGKERGAQKNRWKGKFKHSISCFKDRSVYLPLGRANRRKEHVASSSQLHGCLAELSLHSSVENFPVLWFSVIFIICEYIDSRKIYVCVHTRVCGGWMSVFVCVRACTGVPVESSGWYWVFSSIISIFYIFRDSLSVSQELPGPARLTGIFQGSFCLGLSCARITDVHPHS